MTITADEPKAENTRKSQQIERSHVVRFSKEAADDLNGLIKTAEEIWAECEPYLGEVRFAAGNYAGYGSYSARCHSTGWVEIPVGNQFSLLNVNDNCELVYAHPDRRKFRGIMLHEVGHHAVNTAKAKPWLGWPQCGPSTHLCREWLWICCTAWKHYGYDVDPWLIARAYDDEEQHDAVVVALTHFNPLMPPPRLVEPQKRMKKCERCGEEFHLKRKTRRYCSSKCRSAANREKANANSNHDDNTP